jgi:hypothetical protein
LRRLEKDVLNEERSQKTKDISLEIYLRLQCFSLIYRGDFCVGLLLLLHTLVRQQQGVMKT